MTPRSEEPDRPNRIHWPPLLYLAVIVAAWGLQRVWPLPALVTGAPAYRLGSLLVVVGFAIALAALYRFRQDGTSFDPTAPARAMATRGIYRFTRNPMYLGAIIAFAGFGLAVPSTWLLVLLPALAAALQKLAIEREEAYLERRFGDPYLAYKSRVRRWL